MKLSELKTGHIVTLRNGNEYIVYRGGADKTCHSVLVNTTLNSWFMLNDFSSDLRCGSYREWDIMKVENLPHPYALQDIKYKPNERTLIWERNEPVELTISEIENLLGYRIKIKE